MTPSAEALRRKLLADVFQMPSVQTMVSRKSSITNAFVNSVLPIVKPTADEIEEALTVLGMEATNVRCAYCGDTRSEWDHLRPLVLNHRPTGFISEIANLVPSCGKCNQSKGNKPWRTWMLGTADRSPTARQIADVTNRVDRLDAYERWRTPTKIDFESIIGRDEWENYWSLWEKVIADLQQCKLVADSIRERIKKALMPQ